VVKLFQQLLEWFNDRENQNLRKVLNEINMWYPQLLKIIGCLVDAKQSLRRLKKKKKMDHRIKAVASK
jgi:hypothetical protein